MLKVKCIENNQSNILELGIVYYAFPTGDGTTAYISRFPNVRSSMGGFQLSRFEIIDELESTEIAPTSVIEKNETGVTNETAAAPVLVETFEYVYSSPKRNKNYLVYGFEIFTGNIALYKDKTLSEFIGTTAITNCKVLKGLNNDVDVSRFIKSPKAIRFSDLEGAATFNKETAVCSVELSEQMTLF